MGALVLMQSPRQVGDLGTRTVVDGHHAASALGRGTTGDGGAGASRFE